MADLGGAKNIGVVALTVVLAHGAVLALVVANPPSQNTQFPSPTPIIEILNWKEPPARLPVIPRAPKIPSPAVAAVVPEPEPAALAAPESLTPEPALPRQAEMPPAETPAPEPLSSTAIAPVPAPAEPVYLPQSGVTTAPVVPARELLQRIQYPDRARKLAIQGTVNLELFIDREGVIRRVEVLKDPGYGFAEAALKALEGLVCQPALVGGEAVAVRFRYPVRFTLKVP